MEGNLDPISLSEREEEKKFCEKEEKKGATLD